MSAPEAEEPRRWPVAVDVALGLIGTVLGLLPWLVTGGRLPLQNLWAVETTADAMPRSLLPLSQYYLVLVSALLVTGAAAAGLGFRLLQRRFAPRRLLVVAVLAAAQVGALAQGRACSRAGWSRAGGPPST